MSKNQACVTLGLEPSFGFGDRIGLATPGHVQAMQRAGTGIQPIFPQQSIREMGRTNRSPQQVMDEALAGMRQAGWQGVTGADADHLKTPEDVDRTVAVGFTFFTIDPSDHVDEHADGYDAATLESKYLEVVDQISWMSEYSGKEIQLAGQTKIVLDDEACRRCAVKYGRAINEALQLAQHIAQTCEAAGQDYEIELSVDETEQPTTLAEHYIIADQCLRGGMKLVSLAPRFLGDFEKGVDYKGDLAALEQSLAQHAAIAATLGPYKLSLHSGSDKLSIYSLLAKTTKGHFHVKTAGTSYLEALRVVRLRDEPLFRQIIDFARDRYDVDKATYHVSAETRTVPAPADVSDVGELEKLYLECWDDVPTGVGFTAPGRQILHCTFGSVLTDATLGPAVRGVLESYTDDYTEVLAVHFAKHLEALQAGM